MMVILEASNWSLIHLLNPFIMLVLTCVSSKGHVPPDRLLWLHKKNKEKPFISSLSGQHWYDQWLDQGDKNKIVTVPLNYPEMFQSAN